MNQSATGIRTPRRKNPESGRGFGPSTMACSVRWHRGTSEHIVGRLQGYVAASWRGTDGKAVCSLRRSCPRWLEASVDATPPVCRLDRPPGSQTLSRTCQRSSSRTTSPLFTAHRQLCPHQNHSPPPLPLPCSARLPSNRTSQLPSPTPHYHPSPDLRSSRRSSTLG